MHSSRAYRYASTLLKNFRVLQFSGDADPCVPYVGTQRWINSLNFTIATPWKPWSVTGRGVAGYSTVYDVPDATHKFTFATVRVRWGRRVWDALRGRARVRWTPLRDFVDRLFLVGCPRGLESCVSVCACMLRLSAWHRCVMQVTWCPATAEWRHSR
jgi:hypothetical protein